MRIGRKGQALLLDAFVFLIVVSLVSTALIGLSMEDRGSDEMRNYVDRAHEVFLRTTLPYSQHHSKNITVGHALSLQILHLFDGEENDSEELVDWSSLNDRLTNILRDLVPSHHRFTWTGSCGPHTVQLGEGNSLQNEGGEDILASSLSTYLPSVEKNMVMTLTVWSL